MHAKEEEEEGDLKMNIERDKEGDDHVSILALLVVALRKSLIGCSKYNSSCNSSGGGVSNCGSYIYIYITNELGPLYN